MSDVEVTVRVVNPPGRKRLAASSAAEAWRSLDVLAKVGRQEDGRPVVVVGCVRNGQWVPLTFFDRHSHNWWDRLSYVPQRWLPPPAEEKPRIKSKEKSASMLHYDTRLMQAAPQWRKKPTSCPDAPALDRRLSLKSCAASGDRLSKLPPRRNFLRKQIFKQYHDLYRQMKSCEEAVKKLQLDRSMQKLDEEAKRLKEGLETPSDEEQKKILSLVNCLLDLDSDEFVSNVFAGREEELLEASRLHSWQQDHPQSRSESSSDGSLIFGETFGFENTSDVTTVLNTRESQEQPDDAEDTQEDETIETESDVTTVQNNGESQEQLDGEGTQDELMETLSDNSEETLVKTAPQSANILLEENNAGSELESETELKHFSEPEVQADEAVPDQEIIPSDENELSSTSGSYWSALDQIDSAIAEGSQFEEELSSLPAETDTQPDEENLLNVESNQQNEESSSSHSETIEPSEVIASPRNSSAIRNMTAEFDAAEQLQNESTNDEDTFYSIIEQISDLQINLDNLEPTGRPPVSTVKRTKPKSIEPQTTRRSWRDNYDPNLPWWERLSKPRIYHPTPFYIPPFKATPYVVDPSTPRRTKKPDEEKEPEKFVLQMSARSRKIMKEKSRTGDWWYRLSRPKSLPRQP